MNEAMQEREFIEMLGQLSDEQLQDVLELIIELLKGQGDL